MSKSVTGQQFKLLLAAGAKNLTNQSQYIDSLNVFPVPDGDTGTNMSLTFNAGVNDCLALNSNNLAEVAKTLSKGLLMGARGNSGVILSQIFRGFAQITDNKAEITLFEFAEALSNGAKMAYKAVMRPAEGTILTVVRESSNRAEAALKANPDLTLVEFLSLVVEFAQEALDNTPNLLPILKEAGVIDSGGAGLLLIFEGFLAAAQGKSIALSVEQIKPTSISIAQEEDYGYCTEFIIKLASSYLGRDNETELKAQLSDIGDSVVVVEDEDIVKIHVHSLVPGDILNIAQRYGEFLQIKIENMQFQHENLSDGAYNATKKERKDYSLIAVANGEGLIKAFEELQVDYVVTGGQTMNPATEDFVNAINKANAHNIIVLPNNSNIILAAKQAASTFKDINIIVLETKTIPQGLNACIAFDESLALDENITAMRSAIEKTVSASVTYAIKDSSYNGLKIKAKDYMGILEQEIISTAKNKVKVAQALISMMVSQDSTFLTIICGQDVKVKEESALLAFIESNFTIEFQILSGQQPVYSFIIGVE